MASDQRLVVESVAAALRDRSLDTVVVRWPDAGATMRAERRGPRATRRRATPAPDAGLVLTDLLRMDQVRAARVLVGSLDVPWLVLTMAPRGPAWGAMYDRGATLVLPSGIGLDAASELIADLGDRLAARPLPPRTQAARPFLAHVRVGAHRDGRAAGDAQ